MNTIYYAISYLRILPLKTATAVLNYLCRTIPPSPAIRMEILPLKQRIWNHVHNLYIEPTEIVRGLFLGNAFNASNYSTVNSLGIVRIINVSTDIPNYFDIKHNKGAIEYLNIPIQDDNNHHISQWISTIIEFIDKYYGKNSNKSPCELEPLMVHCYMGSSRSASVVCIILMHIYGYTKDAAIALLKEKRPIVNMNINFLHDIDVWQASYNPIHNLQHNPIHNLQHNPINNLQHTPIDDN
jgi:protein-tyrosine phosphatase